MRRKKKIQLGKFISAAIIFLVFAGKVNAQLTLGTLAINPQPGSAGQGSVLVNVFRLDLPVSGSGGTLTLNSIKVTSGNTADADVASSGVMLWAGTLTGPTTLLGTSGFASGAVTFSALARNLPAGTTYIWVTFNVSASANTANILNAIINAGDITITAAGGATAPGTQPASQLDPASNITITTFAPHVTGGANGGDAAAVKNSDCVSPSNIRIGGSNSGDALGVKNSDCTSPSNIRAGGANAGDAVSIKNSDCTSPSNIRAGGSNSGDAVAIKNNTCTTPYNIYIGGNKSGDAFGVRNSDCTSPSNIFAGSINAGFGTGSFACGSCMAPTLNTSVNNVSCNGGSNGTASVSTTGGTSPFNYAWSNGETTSSVSNLATGTYTVTVTALGGCTATTTVTITEPAPSNLSMGSCSHTDINCFGGNNGTATAGIVSNPTGTVVYSWSNGQTTSSITGLTAATYTLTVSDNCASVTCTQTISQPAPFTITASSYSSVCANDSIRLMSSVSGGTGPYIYSWIGPNGFTSAAADSAFLASTGYSGTYSLTVTDNNGCPASDTANVTVINCNFTYTVKFFIQGYYLGDGKLSPLLRLIDPAHHATTDVDTVTVELHNSTSPYGLADSYRGILKTDGTILCSFASGSTGSFYIVVKHRNSLTTWSSDPMLMTQGGAYDFTAGASQAHSGNMMDLGNGKFGIYSGDVTRDGFINAADKSQVGATAQLFKIAVYHDDDVTGDGYVDEGDYKILENNLPLNISVLKPN